MFTEIKNNIRTVIQHLRIETDLDTVLKEFHFNQVSEHKWRLEEFVIYLQFQGEDKNLNIYLYFKNDLLKRYYSFSHRMWWYASTDNHNLNEQFNKDHEVINDMMTAIRKKWSETK